MRSRYRGSETPADPAAHRLIVLGAAFLWLAREDPRVTGWLRGLLNKYVKAQRDRALFTFEAGRPLVADEIAEPRTSRRRPARASATKTDTRDGDPGPAAARRVTDGGTSDAWRAPAGGGSQAAGASAKGAAHATAGDAELVWSPCRIDADPTSAATGTEQRTWGA